MKATFAIFSPPVSAGPNHAGQSTANNFRVNLRAEICPYVVYLILPVGVHALPYDHLIIRHLPFGSRSIMPKSWMGSMGKEVLQSALGRWRR